jgi:Lrp/AsnC family leucine-responsive transcriptional regulator
MMDPVDLRILGLLQQDARIAMGDLAEQVGLSSPACYRRVRALRENGTIEREAAVVAPATMGWPIAMIVLVTLERDHGPIIDLLIERLRGAPEVIDVWNVTGDHGLVLQVVARDMASYDAFARRTLLPDDYIRSFRTLVVLNHAKRSAALPPARG